MEPIFSIAGENGTTPGPVTSYLYDDDGNQTEVTDPMGNVTTYGYNDMNELVSETDPAPTTGAANPVTTYQYDTNGDQTAVTDPDGNTTFYQYNSVGEQVSEVNAAGSRWTWAYDANGNVISTTDADGRTIDYTYNSLGEVTSENWVGGDYTITYTYNTLGQLTEVTDPDSTYNYTYNGTGQLTSTNDSGTPGVPTTTLNTGYDGFNNLASLSGVVGSTTDFTNAYTYDSLGDMTQVSQSGSAVTSKEADFTYNGIGQFTAMTLSASGTDVASAAYGYDGENRLTSLTYTKSSDSSTINSYGFTFNADGQITAETNSDGTIDYTYDHDGQLTGASGSGLPSSNSYSYDSLGRQSSVDEYNLTGDSLEETSWTNYTYDPVTGQQATITSQNGQINYVYDPATGELIETWTGTSHSSPQNDILYGYDVQGRLESVTQVVLNGETPASVSGTRYNADGDAIATSSPTTLYTYDNNGNLLSVTDPNGTQTTYTYDSQNRLTDELATNLNTNEPVFAEHTDWYDDSLKEDVIDTRYNSDGSTFSKTETTWTYDNDGRLTQEQLTVLSGGSNAPAAYTDAYFYDLVGNRTQENIDGGYTVTGGLTISYVTYNGDNQLTDEKETQYGGGTVYETTYGYGTDGNGNLTTETRTGAGAETTTYGYDLRNRMTSVAVTTGGSTVTTIYTYDTNGFLASESTGGSTTYYLNDPHNPTGFTKAIQESATPGGAPTRSYVLGLDIVAQSDATNGTLYFITDGHGSTRALVNTSGTIAEEYNYDAFGDLLASTGAQSSAAAAKTSWLFGGDGLYDPASGFTYHLARWTNGFWFTQADTYLGNSEDPLSLHKYLYANADPVNSIDPTGFFGLLDSLFGAAEGAEEEAGEAATLGGLAGYAQEVIFSGELLLNAAVSGYVNAINNPNANWGEAFAVGAASGATQVLIANLAPGPAGASAAAAAGQTILQVGNFALSGGKITWGNIGSMAANIAASALIPLGISQLESNIILSKFETWLIAFDTNQAISTAGQLEDTFRKWYNSFK